MTVTIHANLDSLKNQSSASTTLKVAVSRVFRMYCFTRISEESTVSPEVIISINCQNFEPQFVETCARYCPYKGYITIYVT